MSCGVNSNRWKLLILDHDLLNVHAFLVSDLD